MIAEHKAMHRVTFAKKTIYIGTDMAEASRKYFELEPEATEELPLEWEVIVTPTNVLRNVQIQKLRRAPGPNSGVEYLDFDLTSPVDDE